MGGVYVLGCLEETLETLRYLSHLEIELDGIITLREADARRAG